MDQGILDSLSINDIFFDDNQTAYICTEYDGVFRSDNFTSIDDKAIEVEKVSSVFPNPAKDYILVRNTHACSLQDIKIYNIFGEYVLNVGAIHELPLRIDISTLLSGVYFLRISNELPIKFIKL